MSKKWIILVAGSVLITVSIAILVLVSFKRNSVTLLQCESDLVTSKVWASGDSIELSLSTIVFIKYPSSMNVIHKGRMKTAGKSYVIDRSYAMKIGKIDNSNMFHILLKTPNLSPEDTAPLNVLNELQLDNISIFYITRLKNHSWLIHGLLLPVMTCTDF